MKKIVVVMTYFNRPYQLAVTLKSIAKTKYPNFEIVIVDDGSDVPPMKNALTSLPITVLQTQGKCWTNPEPAYNAGLVYAMAQKPDVIVLQNAECYHVGDVLEVAAQVTDANYLSFACFSIDKGSTFNGHDITRLLMENEHSATYDGQCAWYNHPRYRPVAYDFCSAITASNMRQLNGYDERLSSGCGYGDNYLLERIRMLGLRVSIPEYPFVVHQWHYDNKPPANKAQLVEKNRLLFLQLLTQGQPRAVHTYTPDL